MQHLADRGRSYPASFDIHIPVPLERPARLLHQPQGVDVASAFAAEVSAAKVSTQRECASLKVCPPPRRKASPEQGPVTGPRRSLSGDQCIMLMQ